MKKPRTRRKTPVALAIDAALYVCLVSACITAAIAISLWFDI